MVVNGMVKIGLVGTRVVNEMVRIGLMRTKVVSTRVVRMRW